jgi:hypothetical protein
MPSEINACALAAVGVPAAVRRRRSGCRLAVRRRRSGFRRPGCRLAGPRRRRWPDGAAFPQRHRNPVHPGRPRPGQQQFDRLAGQLEVGDRHAGQLRTQPRGQVRVVERHHRHVGRYREARLGEGLVHAEGHPVIDADQRARPAAGGQEAVRRLVRRLRPPQALHCAGQRQSRLGQHLRHARPTLHPGVDLRGDLADQVDALPVAGVQQGTGRAVPGAPLVGQHRRYRRVPVQAVEQDDRVPAQQPRRLRPAGVHAGVEEAVDTAVEHVLHQLLLDRVVAFGLPDEQQMLVCQRGGQAAPDQLAGERLGRDGV